MNEKYYELSKDPDFELYMTALCRLASEYVSRIRVQFAEKAVDMFGNETVRRIVLAYGEEVEKLDHDRLRDFQHVAKYGATTPDHLNDSCLNNSSHYAATIKMLFDIV